MFTAFIQAFKTPDLRKKLLFTLFIMALFRWGSLIPLPGVDYGSLKTIMADVQNNGSLSDLVNMFPDGALLQLSIFASGIMPYITAPIIVQLLWVVIPRFEDLRKEGQTGQAKLTQYTCYLTTALGVLRSTSIITAVYTGALFGNVSDKKIIPPNSAWLFVLQILVMTVATGLIMWMGELVTEKGVGNGMPILAFASIIANLPSKPVSIVGGNGGVRKFFAIVGLILLVILVVVYVEQAMCRIPVQYAKCMVGRRMYDGTTTYIPLKINMANVIPVIFASPLLALLTMIIQFGDQTTPWVRWMSTYFHSTHPFRLTLYALLTLGSIFFYTSVTFNPEEVADNMKKYGGLVPRLRAGRPTADYLCYVMNRITVAGAIYLTIVALVPQITTAAMNVPQLPFGGATILIIVGVGLQTVKNINAQLHQHHYEGSMA